MLRIKERDSIIPSTQADRNIDCPNCIETSSISPGEVIAGPPFTLIYDSAEKSDKHVRTRKQEGPE
jgi:hypothetical protein